MLEADAFRTEAERRIAELVAAREEQEPRALEQEEASRAAEERAAAAERAAETLRERIGELQRDLSGAGFRMSETQATLADARRRIAEVETSNSEAEARAQGLAESKAELEQILLVGSSAREELQLRVTELESELERLRTDMSAGEHTRLLAALVSSRDRLLQAQGRHEQDHARLTRALFQNRAGDGGDAALEKSIATEQSARNSVDQARTEHERAWVAAAEAVPGLETSSHPRSDQAPASGG
jgi:chromosome segregation ATPase